DVGEQDPAVDDEQPPLVLEDGHVAADRAESPARGPAPRPRRQWRGRGHFRSCFGPASTPEWCDEAQLSASAALWASPSVRPAAAQSSRSRAISAALAPHKGDRTGPPGSCWRLRAALVRMVPWVRKKPTNADRSWWWISRARATSPASYASIIFLVRRPNRCGVLTRPTPPTDS